MSPITDRPITRARSLVPLIPRKPSDDAPAMQRGRATTSDEAVGDQGAHSWLEIFEKQRQRASDGDTVKVFTVPDRVFFGLIPVRRQVRATEIAAHLARGEPVIAQRAVMELAQDLVTRRQLMLPRLLPGERRLDSVAELGHWLRQGARLPNDRAPAGEICGALCRWMNRWFGGGA